MKHWPWLTVLFFSLCAAWHCCVAQECPLIDGLADRNCDGMLKITATGDSIVRGRGDKNLTDDSGGYVLRLTRYLPNALTENLGVPGITSLSLYRSFLKTTKKKAETYNKLMDADYLIIEVGTNDYWSNCLPTTTMRNIKRLYYFLRDFSKKNFNTRPYILVSTLPPTRRRFQAPFIKRVNQVLKLKAVERELHVRIGFDQLSTKIISSDGLHPNSSGYQKMSRIVDRALLAIQ